jgi:hypothetical protein
MALVAGGAVGVWWSYQLPTVAADDPPTYFTAEMAEYSYTNDPCDPTARYAPVTVVFTGSATPGNINYTAGTLAGWNPIAIEGASRYFWQAQCAAMSGQNAQVADAVGARFLMNYSHRTLPGYHVTMATPLHERYEYGCGTIIDPPGFDGVDGLRRGKLEIGYRWHQWNMSPNTGGHYLIRHENIENQDPMFQCGTTYMVRNDGWVDIVFLR